MRAKGQLPAGQVPVWVTPDKRILNQKDAIMRYLGRQTGCYSNVLNESYDVDWAIDTLNDVWKDQFYLSWINDKEPSKEEV